MNGLIRAYEVVTSIIANTIAYTILAPLYLISYILGIGSKK